MADAVSVIFPFRTCSAGSFEELMAKSKSNPQSFTGEVVQWYANLVKRFNEGCDILEMRRDESEYHLIDIFDEAAHAKTIKHCRLDFEPESASFLKDKFNTNNLSNVLLNAFYSFDRALDTEARGSVLAAINPANDSQIPIIYTLQTVLVQKGPI